MCKIFIRVPDNPVTSGSLPHPDPTVLKLLHNRFTLSRGAGIPCRKYPVAGSFFCASFTPNSTSYVSSVSLPYLPNRFCNIRETFISQVLGSSGRNLTPYRAPPYPTEYNLGKKQMIGYTGCSNKELPTADQTSSTCSSWTTSISPCLVNSTVECSGGRFEMTFLVSVFVFLTTYNLQNLNTSYVRRFYIFGQATTTPWTGANGGILKPSFFLGSSGTVSVRSFAGNFAHQWSIPM